MFTRAHRYLHTHPLWKYPYAVAGITVGVVLICAGALMLALPGPGLLTILLGLIVLSGYFAWARSSVDWCRAKVEQGRSRLRERRAR